MKKVSFWANNNVAAARALIICIKICLTILSYYIGISLFEIDITLPQKQFFYSLF
jgi:hypothetical protein